MTEARDWVAEHVMGFERGRCQAGQRMGGTWFYCQWCGLAVQDENTSPCSKYPFPEFTLVDLMRKLGEKGHRVTVHIDPEQTNDRFTVFLNPTTFGGSGGKTADTNKPLETLCEPLYSQRNLWHTPYETEPTFFANIRDAIKLLQEVLGAELRRG